MNLFQHPANILFFLGFFKYMYTRHQYIKLTRGTQRVLSRIDLEEKVLLGVTTAGTLLAPVLYLFTPILDFANAQQPVALQALGVLVMLVALWLFRRSHADLGTNWSPSLEVRQDHELVQNGVYRWIRHPMYSAIWLFSLCQLMMLPNWIAGWAGVVCYAPLYILRVPREEALMRDVFGERYTEYMQTTGRVIPRLSTVFGRRDR